MMKKISLLFMICSMISMPLFAQQDATQFDDTLYIVRGLMQDEARLWTAPLRLKTKDLFFWIPVLTVTGIAIRYDEEIYFQFKQFQHGHTWVDQLSPWLTLGGDGTLDMGISTAIYLGGLVLKNNKALQTGMLSAQALAHAGLIVTVGKELSSRKRPHGADASENGLDAWHWFPSGLKEFTRGAPRREYDSFPSGHSISAWSLATVIAGQYSNRLWVPPLCYVLATGVSLSRITEDKHWMSDVLLGSALGFGIGRYMVRHRANTAWTMFPAAWRKNVMLTGIYRF